ncbi:MAG: 50S ribosomal protein L18 [Firmicutes bacterium]|nr:50S ribosomal protein L18 [Bacillota bacterium]
MISKANKNQIRKNRHLRIRNKVFGTTETPRLAVYRSLNGIYAQIIDDTQGVTLVQASTLDKSLEKELSGKNRTEQAKVVGAAVAKRALDKNIKSVVFDRGGYLYTGRVEALADAAREAGLEF